MERLTEILAHLADTSYLASLTGEEVAALHAELDAIFDTLAAEDPTVDQADALVQAADAIEQVQAETTSRETAAAELAEQVAATIARVRGPEDDPEGEDPEGDPETIEAEAETIDPEPEPEPVEDPVAVAAAARPPLAAVRQRVPATARRAPAQSGPRARILAAANVGNIAAGAEMTWHQAAEAMLDQIRASAGSQSTGHARVGTLEYGGYDGRRITAGMSADQVDALVASVTMPGGALIASGGLCAPTDVRYDLDTVSVADRPLRGGLPSFNATRGGIQGNRPSTLTDVVVNDTDGAIDTITVANDVSAVTKTVQEVDCGTSYEVQVTAITERLKFSNFTDRYNPERMAQWIALGRSAHARTAERLLLNAIDTGSTLVNAGTVDVGAARQVIANLMVIAAKYRRRHRMSDDATLRVILPTWIAELVATDLLFQAPGDGTITAGVQGKAWITARLADANISPIWQMDDLDDTPMASDLAAGTHPDYPQSLRSYMFHEGAWLHLDGGTLDFGVVRDGTLNAANRFETFYESFENVALVGIESVAIIHSVVASGVTGAAGAGAGGGVGS